MKNYPQIALSSLLLLFCIVPLGGYGGHPIKFGVANLLYCGLTYYLLINKADSLNKFKVVGMISLPVLLIYLPLHTINFNETLYALPSSLAHLSGICVGFLLAHLNKIRKVALLTLFLSALVWGTSSGYNLWENKVTFGSYTGSVNELISPFTLKTANGQSVTSASMKGQFIVFDFWNTSCGNCFKKFPQLQQYYSRYRKNSNVKFFAVNVPLSRDTVGQAATIIKHDGYTFPVLFAESRSLTSLFKVNSFPTVVILDPSQHIIYRGQLDGIDSPLSELAQMGK